jgi:hypothetical protein
MRLAGCWAQGNGTDLWPPALAHLLAAHSRSTPKQTKEPIFSTRNQADSLTVFKIRIQTTEKEK